MILVEIVLLLIGVNAALWAFGYLLLWLPRRAERRVEFSGLEPEHQTFWRNPGLVSSMRESLRERGFVDVGTFVGGNYTHKLLLVHERLGVVARIAQIARSITTLYLFARLPDGSWLEVNTWRGPRWVLAPWKTVVRGASVGDALAKMSARLDGRTPAPVDVRSAPKLDEENVRAERAWMRRRPDIWMLNLLPTMFRPVYGEPRREAAWMASREVGAGQLTQADDTAKRGSLSDAPSVRNASNGTDDS